jgi:hypothetical protein
MIAFDKLTNRIAVPERHPVMPIDPSMHGLVVDPLEFRIAGAPKQMKSGDYAVRVVAEVQVEGATFALFADTYCDEKPTHGAKLARREKQVAYLAIREYTTEAGEKRHAANLRFTAINA